MNRRFGAALLVSCIAIAAVVLYSTVAVHGPSIASGEWVVPRTPDGHPDLQGNWSSATLTPIQRLEWIQRPALSWEEVTILETAANGQLERGSRPSNPNRPAPPVGGAGGEGNVGGSNGIYYHPGDRIAVVDGVPLSSLITYPSDGRVPALTPEGDRLVAEYREFRSRFGQWDHPELLPLSERCIISFGTSVGPPMLPNGAYNNNYTIVQTGDHVLIMAEMIHDARIIRIGDGPRLPPHIRPWMGDSWGHWEGDVLVVETTNIHPLQRFNDSPADNLTVIERFSRVDEETILYEFTMDDPTIYMSQWGGKVPMKALPDKLYEYACHEGNYSLSNILSGARYQERLEAQRQNEPR